MALDAETFQLLKHSVQRFVAERLMPAEDRVEELDAFFVALTRLGYAGAIWIVLGLGAALNMLANPNRGSFIDPATGDTPAAAAKR
mgnify:CR=1 FL=1